MHHYGMANAIIDAYGIILQNYFPSKHTYAHKSISLMLWPGQKMGGVESPMHPHGNIPQCSNLFEPAQHSHARNAWGIHRTPHFCMVPSYTCTSI